MLTNLRAWLADLLDPHRTAPVQLDAPLPISPQLAKAWADADTIMTMTITGFTQTQRGAIPVIVTKVFVTARSSMYSADDVRRAMTGARAQLIGYWQEKAE